MKLHYSFIEFPELSGVLLNNVCGNIDVAIEAMEENNSGCYTPWADFAEELPADTS